jgi:protein-L-isoaspartate(D-aspartate) O-methyltransferase
MDEADYSCARQKMVNEQIRTRGIRDPRVLSAVEKIPRHLFCPDNQRDWAYSDFPLPIGFGQTISQPYIVALMSEALCLSGAERVLEVGTGSGYQAAVLSRLAAEIHTVEIIPELYDQSQKILNALRITNVFVHMGDGSQGFPDEAPYDGILVTAAAPETPRPLLEQLQEGGRLVIPIGSRGYQRLVLFQRSGSGNSSEEIIPVAFVPLRGKYGWDYDAFN